jgi:hypothetical protein
MTQKLQQTTIRAKELCSWQHQREALLGEVVQGCKNRIEYYEQQTMRRMAERLVERKNRGRPLNPTARR